MVPTSSIRSSTASTPAHAQMVAVSSEGVGRLFDRCGRVGYEALRAREMMGSRTMVSASWRVAWPELPWQQQASREPGTRSHGEGRPQDEGNTAARHPFSSCAVVHSWRMNAGLLAVEAEKDIG